MADDTYLNQLPAVLIGGPPHSGKSVLIYSLSQALRARGVAHYALRACPDGEGDFSNETDQAPENYQSRLYRNDGHGGFAFDPQGIAPTMTSGQRAAIGDADGDGDLDIFLGGRIIPGRYPAPPRSYLLLNDGAGHFADATQERAPEISGTATQLPPAQ